LRAKGQGIFYTLGNAARDVGMNYNRIFVWRVSCGLLNGAYSVEIIDGGTVRQEKNKEVFTYANAKSHDVINGHRDVAFEGQRNMYDLKFSRR
jgi:hypothetical protein